MNEHKRETLNRLREAVGRILVEKTPRRGFTAKQRQSVLSAWEGRCHCCDETIDGPWDVDHIIPIALGGLHEPSNWAPILRDHHKIKSRADVKAIAKVARIRAKDTTGKKPSRLVSKGFDKTMRRKFDGTVEKRK